MHVKEEVGSLSLRPGDVARLQALQRRLHSATSVGQLLACACIEAPNTCGFERAIVLAIAEGTLSSSGVDTIEDAASDALRRQSLATPIALTTDCEEADVIRAAEGLTPAPAPGHSVVKEALSLGHHAVAAVVPEGRAVALLVVDRAQAPVTAEDRGVVDLFAHLLGLAIEHVTLRLRMEELATELRHLTASAHALMHEALEAPVTLGLHQGIGALFTVIGASATPAGLGDQLSDRERAIAALMVSGRSNREIGEELHLSPDTVKAYVARLVRKLGAANRVDAVARYVALTGAGGAGAVEGR